MDQATTQTATPAPAPAAQTTTAPGMASITFVEDNKTFQVPTGTNIRKFAKANGITIYTGWTKYTNCLGNGLCGTCRVSVDPTDNAGPLTFFERFTLGNNAGKFRLACQSKVTGDCKVKLKPAYDYAEVHKNTIINGSLIGAFSLMMLGLLGMIFFDIAGKWF
ncbi:MAG TPA: 2Fe-2S iron-sulfur cluster-binding protein [Candidatus Kapabacteria bacterium]|nr:2Fe-2S iron-sulfur cluster-binding protein [Candidatus Kapabacteria bacterium]